MRMPRKREEIITAKEARKRSEGGDLDVIKERLLDVMQGIKQMSAFGYKGCTTNHMDGLNTTERYCLKKQLEDLGYVCSIQGANMFIDWEQEL